MSLTDKQAKALLPKTDLVHVFEGGPVSMKGYHMRKTDLLEQIKTSKCEIAGPRACRMKHGLLMWSDGGRPIFVECRPDVDYSKISGRQSKQDVSDEAEGEQ